MDHAILVKPDLLFGRADVHVDRRGINLYEDDGIRITPFHKARSIAFDDRVGQEPFPHASPVHVYEQMISSRPVPFRRGEVSAQPQALNISLHRDYGTSDLVPEKR